MYSGEKISLDKVKELEAEEGDILVMEDTGLPTDAVESLGEQLYEQTGLKLILVPDIDKVGVLKTSKLKDDSTEEQKKETRNTSFISKILN